MRRPRPPGAGPTARPWCGCRPTSRTRASRRGWRSARRTPRATPTSPSPSCWPPGCGASRRATSCRRRPRTTCGRSPTPSAAQPATRTCRCRSARRSPRWRAASSSPRRSASTCTTSSCATSARSSPPTARRSPPSSCAATSRPCEEGPRRPPHLAGSARVPATRPFHSVTWTGGGPLQEGRSSSSRAALITLGTVPARARLLVVVPSDTDPPGRLGEWLSAAGLALDERRLDAGDPLPDDLSAHDGLLVLGGPQSALDDEGTSPGLAGVRVLLRRAIAGDVPTLAICLGAQLVAQVAGGAVRPGTEGPEVGAALVAKRDAADSDPVFGPLPLSPDVVQWHHDEIASLPPGATLLAS